MIPNIKISKTLVDKLDTVREPKLAKIYGLCFENTVMIVAVQVETDRKNVLEYSLPTEVDLFGLISINNEDFNHGDIIKKLQEIDITDNPIFLTYSGKISSYVLINEQLQSKQFAIISEQEMYEQLVYIRLSGQLSMNCLAEHSAFEEAVLELRNTATSGKFAFNFPKTPVYLLRNENEIENSLIGTSGEPIVGDICRYINSNEDSEIKKSKKTARELFHVLDVILLRKTSKENINSNEKEHAPICIVSKKSKNYAHIPVKIDVLSLISKQANLNRLYDILVESIIKSLKAFQETLSKNLEDKSKLVIPEVFHFYPGGCGHFVSIWMPNIEDNAFETSRRSLHERFLLPTNRPLFRKVNMYSFKKSIPSDGIIINPHENLKTSNNGGQVAVVKGNYDYYHYNQNNINDDGWGCAYRSLQTLASWFKHQGYIDRDVPSFSEIQKCLVDIGDKPSNFIGSKQWIGSMEVNFVLNTLLGITCRIVNVSNGTEMAYEGPTLLRHFQEIGTPVMIGGGSLAHTILGVDYNASTDTVKFLILDPHYVGPEDLQVIQNKGWCGWKTVNFWNTSSYYNMCLPFVPSGV